MLIILFDKTNKFNFIDQDNPNENAQTNIYKLIVPRVALERKYQVNC